MNNNFTLDIWNQNYTVEQINLPDRRVYNCNNEHTFPSITTVLGAADDGQRLIDWKERVGEDFAERRSRKALSIGNGLHDLSEKYLLNQLTNRDIIKSMPEVRSRFNTYKKFLSSIDVVHFVERPLYSTILGIAGTCDALISIDGKVTVLDHKTSFSPKEPEHIENYFIQSSFYAYAVSELYRLNYIPRICVAIAVEGAEEPQVFFGSPRDHAEGIINALKLYREKYD